MVIIDNTQSCKGYKARTRKNENRTVCILPALRDIVTVDEAIKRYDASIKWITEHNHAIIGNGPYEIKNYNPTGRVISLTAFRDSSYPFVKGFWSNYETAKLAKFEKVQYPKIVTRGFTSIYFR